MTGWEWPKCGKCYAPFVAECETCGKCTHDEDAEEPLNLDAAFAELMSAVPDEEDGGTP